MRLRFGTIALILLVTIAPAPPAGADAPIVFTSTFDDLAGWTVTGTTASTDCADGVPACSLLFDPPTSSTLRVSRAVNPTVAPLFIEFAFKASATHTNSDFRFSPRNVFDQGPTLYFTEGGAANNVVQLLGMDGQLHTIGTWTAGEWYRVSIRLLTYFAPSSQIQVRMDPWNATPGTTYTGAHISSSAFTNFVFTATDGATNNHLTRIDQFKLTAPRPDWTQGPCNVELARPAGVPLSIPLAAHQPLYHSPIEIKKLSLPGTMLVTAHTAANPVSTTATWTNPIVGHHTIAFNASESSQAFTRCYGTLAVSGVPTARAGADACRQFGESHTFNGSTSSMPQGIGAIASYSWRFPSGATATGPVVTRALDTPYDVGTHNTRLTVTSTDGLSGTDDVAITTITTYTTGLTLTRPNYGPHESPNGTVTAYGCGRVPVGANVTITVTYSNPLTNEIMGIAPEPVRQQTVWRQTGTMGPTGHTFEIPPRVIPSGQGHYRVDVNVVNGSISGSASKTFTVP